MDERIHSFLYNLKQLILYIWELTIVQGIFVIFLAKRIFRIWVPPELKSLVGEVILITGAGNGIGKQIALNLGNLGAVLVCWDIESEANSKLVNDLCTSGTKAFGYEVDIGDIEAIRRTAAKVRKEVGKVTMIINNAGIVPNGPFMDIKAEVEEKMYRVNVLSHSQILREFFMEMKQNNHGHIVTVASLATFFPAKELAGYTASKHANYGFIEAIKQELEDDPLDTSNIHFTTVYPCFVKTRLMDGVTLTAKFPTSFPIVSPEYVGAEVVRAIRQNVEHLFIPRRTKSLPFLRALLPTEVKKRLQKSIFKLDVDRSMAQNNNW